VIIEADQHEAWKQHIDRYGVCPRCGADSDLEGSCDVVDPKQPGEPVVLRELHECPACDHRWHEEWIYRGQGQEGAH